MFIDEVQIHVSAGQGWAGLVSWRREKYIPKGGPWGGDGWDGWNVIIKASEHLNTLSEYRHKKFLSAETWEKGMPNLCHGRNGEDLVLQVPVGTLIFDADSWELLHDLDVLGMKIIIAKWWRGGYGNAHFCSSTRQAPAFAELGDIPEEKNLRLELKLVADIGIIGIPSAGKSTLISKLSNVKPKIGDYPFTTLTPNLGVLDHKWKSLVLEDVPGLIPWASEWKWLGIEFLKHIERTWTLLHLLDLYRLDSVFQDYEDIRRELGLFSSELLEKQELIVFSKWDLLDDEMREHIVNEFQSKYPGKKFLLISAATGLGIDELKDYLVENFLPVENEMTRDVREKNEDSWNTERKIYDLKNEWEDPKQVQIEYIWELKFRARGRRLEQIVRMTDFENAEAVMRVYNVLEKMWVMRSVEKKLDMIMKEEWRDNSFFFEGGDENMSPKILVWDKEIPLEKMKFKL